MILLDKPYASIEWDDKGFMLVTTWKDFVAGKEYRAVLDEALELLTERDCSRMLSDLRAMKVIAPEDQGWLERDWAPRAKASPFRHSAILVPKSALAKMSLQRVVTSTSPELGEEFQTVYFSTMEEAKQWLRAMPAGRR